MTMPLRDHAVIPALLRTQQVIHAAIMVSVVLYAAPLHVLVRTPVEPGATPTDPSVVRWIVPAGMALGSLVVTVASLLVARAKGRAQDVVGCLRMTQGPRIMRLAGAEFMALSGFVSGMLGHGMAPYYLPAAVALGVMAVFFPRASTVGPRG